MPSFGITTFSRLIGARLWDQDDLDVAAAGLPLPGLADLRERNGLDLETDPAGRDVPQQDGVAAAEVVHRDREVRVAENLELLRPQMPGDDRRLRPRRLA